jgi:hypothetical protein
MLDRHKRFILFGATSTSSLSLDALQYVLPCSIAIIHIALGLSQGTVSAREIGSSDRVSRTIFVIFAKDSGRREIRPRRRSVADRFKDSRTRKVSDARVHRVRLLLVRSAPNGGHQN